MEKNPTEKPRFKLKRYSDSEIKAFFKKNAEQILYFSSLAMLIFSAYIRSTMFEYSLLLLKEFFIVSCILIAAKVLIFQRKSKLRLIIYLLIAALCVIVRIRSDVLLPIPLMLITVGAENIPFKKIAKFYAWMTLFLTLFTVVMSLCGVIENLQYIEKNTVRNSFGICYPTDFAAHVFFTMASFAAAYKEKIRYIHCAAGAAVSVLVFCFCRTRVDCGCMLMLCAGVAIIKFTEKHPPSGKNKPYRAVKVIARFACIWSMPIAAASMLMLTRAYDPSVPLMSKLDNILSSRLRLGNRGLCEYPITFFGQDVPMQGLGGSTVYPENYFFLDCSYVYCLLKLGIIFTLLIIGGYVLIGMRYRKNGYLLLITAVIAVNCMIAHHLPDCGYSVFTAAVFGEGGIMLSEIFRKNRADKEKSGISTAPDG